MGHYINEDTKKNKNFIEKISNQSKSLNKQVYIVCQDIFKDERLLYWTGSGEAHQHHFGQGGLIEHISEVIDLCFTVKDFYKDKYEIDEIELFFSAFFHDIGKLWDYEAISIDSVGNKEIGWRPTDHKRMIHHISRSGIVWSENCKKSPEMYALYHDKVLHAILSHHMAREYGSPVAPKSRVAWILTLCDNLSARMDDADTLDIIRKK